MPILGVPVIMFADAVCSPEMTCTHAYITCMYTYGCAIDDVVMVCSPEITSMAVAVPYSMGSATETSYLLHVGLGLGLGLDLS